MARPKTKVCPRCKQKRRTTVIATMETVDEDGLQRVVKTDRMCVPCYLAKTFGLELKLGEMPDQEIVAALFENMPDADSEE